MTISIGIYVLIGLFIVLLIWMIRFEMRLKRLFMGKNGRDLEEAMNALVKYAENLEKTQNEINSHLKIVDGKLAKSIRQIETVRFNPFEDAGSNQSFAISMINDEGDGVVLSSLYARDRMSIFAKPIKNNKSDFELSIEEKEVLNKAK